MVTGISVLCVRDTFWMICDLCITCYTNIWGDWGLVCCVLEIIFGGWGLVCCVLNIMFWGLGISVLCVRENVLEDGDWCVACWTECFGDGD